MGNTTINKRIIVLKDGEKNGQDQNRCGHSNLDEANGSTRLQRLLPVGVRTSREVFIGKNSNVTIVARIIRYSGRKCEVLN